MCPSLVSPTPSHDHKGSLLVPPSPTGRHNDSKCLILNGCPLLQDLHIKNSRDISSLILDCSSLRDLDLRNLPNLKTCEIVHPFLWELCVVRCPLFDASSIITPTLCSLKLCQCIVSVISMGFLSYCVCIHGYTIMPDLSPGK